MKKLLPIILILIAISQIGLAQIYIEKQTRHRFAQLNLGVDLETNFGGRTQYLDKNNELVSLNLKSTYMPRFIIGGTHFWGHADFYIAIPLFYPKIKDAGQEMSYRRGVETVFKYYPWKIKHHKIRPYLGISLASSYFEQSNNNHDFGNGPELNHTNFPLLSGFTFNHKNHLLELGMAWNYANEQDYYLSRTVQESIETPPIYMNLSYKFMLETTISAEKPWESGRITEITEQLATENKLNSFYAGVGLSSVFWLKESTYNTENRPYIETYRNAIMPDFTVGYYLHQPDMNIAIAYRGYRSSTNTYGASQTAKRKSLAFEVAKILFDYHGFVPFLGPAISYEKLGFEETFENQPLHDVSTNKIGYGLTFGWDIRPTRLQKWILRTNLRWFPNLDLEVIDEKSISFDNIEFNFIQFILYINR